MKLKTIGAVALALSIIPSLVFGQGLMAKLKAKMAGGKAAVAGAMHKKGATGGTSMGTMGGMHMGSIIGNKNTKVYHMPGDKNLPEEKNRVYFSSVSAAEAAGYHASGSKGGSKSTKSSKMTKTSASTMTKSPKMKHKKK